MEGDGEGIGDTVEDTDSEGVFELVGVLELELVGVTDGVGVALGQGRFSSSATLLVKLFTISSSSSTFGATNGASKTKESSGGLYLMLLALELALGPALKKMTGCAWVRDRE